MELGRYLKHLGYEVCYVRNFTDVDDKVSLVFIHSALFLISFIFFVLLDQVRGWLVVVFVYSCRMCGVCKT